MDEEGALEAGEDAGDADEIVLALEELVAGFPVGDPGQTRGGVDVEDDDEVGPDGEGLVHPADPPGIDALGPLIGDGREVIAVEDDDFAGRQGGLEVLLDVLAPVLDEELQFLLGRQGIGPRGQALDLPAPSSPGRLAEEDGLAAAAAKAPEKGLGLGRLAGAVDPFEDDEEAAAALGGHGRSS